MQLPKLFKKTSVSNKIVAISFLIDGIAVAISERQKDLSLKLIHAEFIVSQGHEDQQNALSYLIALHKLNDCDCHLVLVGNDYHRLNIEAPHVASSEMIGAIRWKINELIDFSADNAAIAYYPAPSLANSSYAEALEVVICQQSIFHALTEKCLQAGLNLKVVDIQETSLRALAMLMPETANGVAVLHLQKSFGVVLIQKDATIYVFRRFELGYEKLELYAPVTRGSVSEAAFNALALEIRRSLDYVESYYAIESIGQLAVIPFNEYSQQLVATLVDNYGIKAGIVDLSELVDGDMSLDMETQSLCAAVIGASLHDASKIAYTQEINLYAETLFQPPKYANLPIKSGVLLVLIAGVFLYSGYLSRDQKKLEALVLDAQKAVAEDEARLKAVVPNVQKIELNPELEKEITLWHEALTELNQAVEQFSDKNAVQSQGFSVFFQALANKATADIWLTDIYFNGKQRTIRLEGSTLKPKELSVFLQNLQQQSVFQGYSFAQLLMQQDEKKPGQINFKLNSTLETPEKK